VHTERSSGRLSRNEGASGKFNANGGTLHNKGQANAGAKLTTGEQGTGHMKGAANSQGGNKQGSSKQGG
jgi:hypothetical protein